ncbi:copper chaperone CopZ [Ureibacillus acetophenoni]|uniref:Copper chaperone CopZ n=1 Tax=Ureibacillus acetophenoni TaxID=614649 RepID=A0A285UD55_9BACL|nr:copper chaperone CopZ [Ureibacillus acetophenoni]SOC39627.1 copper chaperone [Ureibacillus acetophenoni]
MESVTLNVKGMSCGHCVKAVEGGVSALAGVDQVKVILEEGQVEVTYDNDKVSLAKIKDAIDDQGYDVE